MATEQHTCVSISCDVCGDGLDNGEGITPHFANLAEAAGYDDAWLINEKEQLCARCRCARDGHGRLVSFGGISGKWCERCDDFVEEQAEPTTALSLVRGEASGE